MADPADLQMRMPPAQLPPLYADEALWVSDRLDVQIRSFGRLTVLTPTGVLGQAEWRLLTRTVRAMGPERVVVLDLIETSAVTGPVLLTILAASRRPRRSRTFLMANNPLTRKQPGGQRILRTLAGEPRRFAAPRDSNAPARVAGPAGGVPNQRRRYHPKGS